MATFIEAYQIPIRLAEGAWVGSSGVFDFNGDGYDDIAIGQLKWPPSYELLPLLVFKNNRDGTFSEVTNQIFGGSPGHIHPREILAGDFNGDGLDDLFVADHGYDANPFPGLPNSLLLSSGGGLTNGRSNIPDISDFTHSISISDVNQDGALDILVGNIWGQQGIAPYLLINDGQGNFTQSSAGLPSFLTNLDNGFYVSQKFGDINGDGAPDIFLGSGGNGHRILLNDGSGSFTDSGVVFPGAFGGASEAVDIRFFDVNGDGRTDILVSSYRSDFSGVGTQLFVQQEDGTFVDEASMRFGVGDEDVSYWRLWSYVEDFNGDGFPDILSVYNGQGAPAPDLWLNDGTGHFQRSKLDYLWSNFAFVGDFNGDGKPDIGAFQWDGIKIFLNDTPGYGSVRHGTAGNDLFLSVEGSDVTFHGGLGTDTIRYFGTKDAHQVTFAANGEMKVQKPENSEDTLVSIERLEFSDGTLAFDFDGVAGQTFRLYQAAFDRTPDTAGLSYWIGRLDSGTTNLKAVAESFLDSPEFVRTYGTESTVSNPQFIELLYLHTLGREYEQQGFDYWVERLDGGHTNRGDLLAFFSESDENVARVAPAIQDGIWFV